MKHLYLIITLILALSQRAFAQTDLNYNLRKYAASANALVYGQHLQSMDLENHPTYMVRSTGALVDWLLNDSSQIAGQLRRQERSVLSMGADNNNTAGHYIHHEGHRQTFGEVLAGGELRIKNIGTLYGKAIYRNGHKRGTHLNYAVHPEDYAPYLVSDTLGKRNMNQEIYTVMSGFSFPFKSCHLGVEVSYEGIAQAGRTDPKHANYAHTMSISLSGAKAWNRNAVAVRFAPEWSLQTISAKSIQDGISFFEFYGFGLWNRKESKGAITYGRTQTLRGFFTGADWFHAARWHWAASAGYRLRLMNAEVGAFKNLFSSETNQLQQQLLVGRRFHVWELLFRAEAIENMRKGEEHVYEQQFQNQELYDYVKVGTNRLYNHDWYTGDFKTKLIYHLSSASAIGLIGGTTWEYGKESYKTPAMKVENGRLTTLLGVDYKVRTAKSQVEIEAYARQGKGRGNRYNLLEESTEVQKSIAFIPYLLKGEDHRIVGVSAAYAREVAPRCTLGARLAVSSLKSDYRRVTTCQAAVFMLF